MRELAIPMNKHLEKKNLTEVRKKSRPTRKKKFVIYPVLGHHLVTAACGGAHLRARVVNKNQTDRPLNIHTPRTVNNQNISFLPAITSTSTRMHGEFLRLLFLQAHRETTTHFTALGMPAQQLCDS